MAEGSESTSTSARTPSAAPDAEQGASIWLLRQLRAELGERQELRALGVLRQRAWQRDVEDRIERAVQTLPEEAGPLNSQMLVIKALVAIEDRAPEYLRHWVSYLDTLLWLEEQS